MSTINKVPWQQFAEDLVTSGEIDPPYILGANLVGEVSWFWQCSFFLYYFLFYDLKGAADCATSREYFWEYVDRVYPTATRGAARRHFRGKNGLEAIRILKEYGSPVSIFEALYNLDYGKLCKHIDENFKGAQIGPYFAWKLMDIFDRCLGMPVTLTLEDAITYLPDVPRKCIKRVWPEASVEQALTKVLTSIEDLPAPGMPGRNCGCAEAETILCAMEMMVKGSYKMGSDILLRRQQLAEYPALLELMPSVQDWSHYAAGIVEPA